MPINEQVELKQTLTHCPTHRLCAQSGLQNRRCWGFCRYLLSGQTGDSQSCHPCLTVPPGLLAKQPPQPQSTGERALLHQTVSKTRGSLLNRALPRGKAMELPAGMAGHPFLRVPIAPNKAQAQAKRRSIFFLFAESYLNIFEFQQPA